MRPRAKRSRRGTPADAARAPGISGTAPSSRSRPTPATAALPCAYSYQDRRASRLLHLGPATPCDEYIEGIGREAIPAWLRRCK
jgi:hypothetical protein